MNVNEIMSSSTINTSKKNKNVVDKDFFMKLLVEQLKHQDPLSPMDNTEYLNQTAQFSTLETIQALSKDFAENKAYQLLGKTIVASREGCNEYFEGVVSSLAISDGEVYLQVGDEYFSPENVLEVKNE